MHPRAGLVKIARLIWSHYTAIDMVDPKGKRMKKAIFTTLIIALLLLVSPLPGNGFDGGHGYHGGYGYRGGYGYGGRYWRGPYYGGGVWIGPGWGSWWGAPLYGGVLPYPYYATPPVVVQQSPPVYVEPAPQPDEAYYWYYCENPKGYYPYVKQCPNGWMKVVPSPAPPGQ